MLGPYTTDELAALERDFRLPPAERRFLATVRDRERQRDSIAADRDERSAHYLKVCRERDELQRHYSECSQVNRSLESALGDAERQLDSVKQDWEGERKFIEQIESELGADCHGSVGSGIIAKVRKDKATYIELREALKYKQRGMTFTESERNVELVRQLAEARKDTERLDLFLHILTQHGIDGLSKWLEVRVWRTFLRFDREAIDAARIAQGQEATRLASSTPAGSTTERSDR